MVEFSNHGMKTNVVMMKCSSPWQQQLRLMGIVVLKCRAIHCARIMDKTVFLRNKAEVIQAGGGHNIKIVSLTSRVVC